MINNRGVLIGLPVRSASGLSSRRKNLFFPRGAGMGRGVAEKGLWWRVLCGWICRITAHYVTNVGWNWAEICLIQGHLWRFLCHIMRRGGADRRSGWMGVAFISDWWGAGRPVA